MKRKLTILVCIGTICISCSSKSQITVSGNKGKLSAGKSVNVLSLQDSVINFGMKYLTTPYRYGGTTPRGFDCSGFTSYVYRNFGYDLSRSSRDQAKQFPAISKKDLQTGDLVFFEGRSHNGVVGHVGIVTEKKTDREFRFIHASVNRGVVVSSSDEGYYASRYLKAGRVIDKPSYASSPRQQTFPEISKNENRQNNVYPEAKETNEAVYHVVKRGENLAGISKEYDVPISTIQHLNNLKSKRIKRGQRLLIAKAATAPSMPTVSAPIIMRSDLESTDNKQIKPPKENKAPDSSAIKINPQSTKIENKTIESAPSRKIEHQEKTGTTRIELKQEKMQKHRVISGESLFSIAKKYNLTVDKLKMLNNLTSNSINAGEQLIVSDNPAVSATNNVIQTETTSPKKTIHTVKQGDTLYSIARQYGCSVSDIKKWNPDAGDAIKIGDKIQIEQK